ncbi:MAG: sulfatase-like hydrolase/transferase [Bacteroidetes bacterium]|nr:sulfatase-like hydrolase/transferase [Bacteroidota bacterium]
MSRLLFFSINTSYFDELQVGRYFQLAGYALRFDLSTICTINLFYAFLMLIPFSFVSNKMYQFVLQILFVVSNVIALLFDIGDIAYFPYVRKRMSADVFDLMSKKSDFIDLLPSYLQSFWYIPILMLVFVFGFTYFNNKLIVSKHHITKVNTGLMSWLMLLIALAVFIIAIRGGLQLKPILNSNARLVANNEEVPIVLNTPFSILHSFEQASLTRMNYYSETTLRKYFNPIHNYKREQPQKMNVVLIILESFGKAYTGIGGRKSYTPCLDSLMRNGLVFSNAFANAHRSSDGVPACIAGIPAAMDEAFITSKYATNSFEALPNLLKPLGYSTSFFHGGTNGTMSFDIFCKSAGFDQYYGRTEYANDKDYDGTWGIWDEPYLQYFASTLGKQKQPFLSAVFTLSSHEPFTLPSSFHHNYIQSLRGIQRGIAYSDWALKNFFESASQTSWFKNTLFVITADHNFLAAKDDQGYYNAGMGLYAIPVLFYSPIDKNLMGNRREVFQQIDIMPTILDYLHYPQPFFAYGNSGFDSSRKPIVYTQMGSHTQMLIDNYLVTADNMVINGLYDFSRDSTMKNYLHMDSLDASLFPRFKAFKQLLNNTIIDNKQTAESFLVK